MHKEMLFETIRSEVEPKFHFLQDKPEESVESTLKALWQTAAGNPVSAELSMNMPLPDLTRDQTKRLHELIQKRLDGLPLAHITGRQRFMNIELISDKRALIPRKETEILGNRAVEVSRQISAEKGTHTVIDVCCGSGNLAMAIAMADSGCRVLATDISHEAVALARENAAFLNLANNRVVIRQGNLLEAFDEPELLGTINLMVCNPPYISSAKVTKMDTEISTNEPSLAFDGGMLGTSVIQRLIREAPRFLAPGGYLLFEVGLGQGSFIEQLCERTGLYTNISHLTDKEGNIRVINLKI